MLDWRRHRRGQLLYAAKGVVAVRTPQGAWVAPPERSLLVAASAIEPEYQVAGRDGMVRDCWLPNSRAALGAKCHAFLAKPSPRDSIDEWSTELGLGRRRAFRRVGHRTEPLSPLSARD